MSCDTQKHLPFSIDFSVNKNLRLSGIGAIFFFCFAKTKFLRIHLDGNKATKFKMSFFFCSLKQCGRWARTARSTARSADLRWTKYSYIRRESFMKALFICCFFFYSEFCALCVYESVRKPTQWQQFNTHGQWKRRIDQNFFFMTVYIFNSGASQSFIIQMHRNSHSCSYSLLLWVFVKFPLWIML